MGIIKRILLILFGLLSGLFGFLSLLLVFVFATGELFGKRESPDDFGTGLRIFMIVWIFIVCEVFLAFGITALLFALRCIFGPRAWLIRIINFCWSRAMKFALIMPLFGIASGIIFWIVEFFIS
jgi:hypothetical protein